MKTVNIQGRPYAMVNERIKEFRDNSKGHALVTKIIKIEGDFVLFRAQVRDPEGRIVATGHASEIKGVGKDKFAEKVNSTSHIENCETSAMGRALGNFGIGIDAAFASGDEVQSAVAAQKTPSIQQPADLGICKICKAPNKWSVKASKPYCGAMCWKKKEPNAYEEEYGTKHIKK